MPTFQDLPEADKREVMNFAYEAVESSNRRKQQTSHQKKHLDRILTAPKRKKAENISQDLLENHALVGWAIRRHLDSVTRFYFEVDQDLPDEIRRQTMKLFDWHGKARNFDAARRHSRDEAFRLAEISKIVDGDVLMAKIGRRTSRRYGSLQLIEGTRITRPLDLPKSFDKRVNEHGLELDEWGGVNAYIICKYNERGTKLVYDKRILADQAIYSGYFDRYSACRGVSPLLAAANQYLDLADANEYQLLKIKLHALFGYYITREMLDVDGADGLSATNTPDEDADAYDDDDSHGVIQEEVDFSEGPVALDLDPGEKVGMIESNTPPESVKAFTELQIRIALLSLDIPYTFFDGDKANFSKIVADRKTYEASIHSKAEKNREMVEQYRDWKLSQWVANGDITGISFDKLRDSVHVRKHPTAWLDALTEIQFEERMVALGLKSIPTLGKERGIDVYEEMKKQEAFLREAESRNVPVYIGDPGARSEKDNDIDNVDKISDKEVSNEQA